MKTIMTGILGIIIMFAGMSLFSLYPTFFVVVSGIVVVVCLITALRYTLKG